MNLRINYRDIDTNVILIVKELNNMKGVQTVGSCGGHENPIGGQWPLGEWYVKFEVSHSQKGWLILEFLAWAINNDCRKADKNVILLPVSPPPYLNGPNKCLCFVIQGKGEDPNELANFLRNVYEKLFITDKEWAAADLLTDDDIDSDDPIDEIAEGEGG